jgi:hypothetical protein
MPIAEIQYVGFRSGHGIGLGLKDLAVVNITV